jgi:TolB protein
VTFFRPLRTAAAVAAFLSLTVVPVAHAFDPTEDRETHLLSRSLSGGFPNGSSQNAAFSQDGQGARLAAFDSDASDLVAGDTNGLTDVFVVRRGGHFTTIGGEPWQPDGGAQLVSVGMGGQPANGRSYKPDVDGDALVRNPHCIAFVSDASNLVPGDANGKPDAFLRDLSTGTTTRVSVGLNGAESNGTTYDVQVDGACSRVAFTSDATNLYLSKAQAGRNKFLRPLATQAPAPGTKQVYVRSLNNLKDNAKIGGVTFLASASNRKVPGFRSSYDASFGQIGEGCPTYCGTTSGDSLSFTSDAENLTTGDHNGKSDIYQRNFFKPVLNYKQRRKGKKAYLKLSTLLVSSTASGQAANGASFHSASNDNGEYIAFATDATNLVPGDSNGATDVVMRGMWKTSKKRMFHVSNAKETGQANGASDNPTITSPASILFFESDGSNLQPNPPKDAGVYYDRNCMRDVFFWNYVSTNASLQSRNSNQEILNLPENSGGSNQDRCPPNVAAGSENPASSYYGNYFLFESSYPLIDLPLADRALPTLLKTFPAAAVGSHDQAALHQVYLRYNGPKSADSTYPASDWPLPADGSGAPANVDLNHIAGILGIPVG